MARSGVLHTAETEALLYGPATGQPAAPYVPGSRPFLERYLASVRPAWAPPAEQAIAICLAIADIPRRYPPAPAFLYGESDEEVILKGGGHCSCRSRLLCALLQMLGHAARPVMMWTWHHPDEPALRRGGHTVVEARVAGEWLLLDPMIHLFARGSVRELRQDRERFVRPAAADLARMEPVAYPYRQPGVPVHEHYWDRYLHPHSPVTLGHHDVTGAYTVRWHWATEDFRERMKHDAQQLATALSALVAQQALTEAVYRLDVAAFRRHCGIRDFRVPAWA
jgi:hypothetical protein